MKFSDIPDCSSQKAAKALERLGCWCVRIRGSHAHYARTWDDRVLVATLVMGKKSVSKRILKDVLTKFNISVEEFRNALS